MKWYQFTMARTKKSEKLRPVKLLPRRVQKALKSKSKGNGKGEQNDAKKRANIIMCVHRRPA